MLFIYLFIFRLFLPPPISLLNHPIYISFLSSSDYLSFHNWAASLPFSSVLNINPFLPPPPTFVFTLFTSSTPLMTTSKRTQLSWQKITLIHPFALTGLFSNKHATTIHPTAIVCLQQTGRKDSAIINETVFFFHLWLYNLKKENKMLHVKLFNTHIFLSYPSYLYSLKLFNVFVFINQSAQCKSKILLQILFSVRITRKSLSIKLKVKNPRFTNVYALFLTVNIINNSVTLTFKIFMYFLNVKISVRVCIPLILGKQFFPSNL